MVNKLIIINSILLGFFLVFNNSCKEHQSPNNNLSFSKKRNKSLKELDSGKESLENQNSINENIASNNQINIETKGINKEDFDSQKQFSPVYPEHREMWPGPNFEGQCPNKFCVVYGKDCWSPMRCFNEKFENDEIFKEIKKNIALTNKIKLKLNLGQEMRLAICPKCKCFLNKVKAYGFSKSKVKIFSNDVLSEIVDTSEEPKYFYYKKLAVNKNPNDYLNTHLDIEINLDKQENNTEKCKKKSKK